MPVCKASGTEEKQSNGIPGIPQQCDTHLMSDMGALTGAGGEGQDGVVFPGDVGLRTSSFVLEDCQRIVLIWYT